MKQNIISPNPNVLIKDMNQVEFVSFMVNTVSPTMVQHQLDNLDQVMDQTTEVIEKVMPRAIEIAEDAMEKVTDPYNYYKAQEYKKDRRLAENAFDQAIGPDDRSAEEIISDERQEYMDDKDHQVVGNKIKGELNRINKALE